MRDILTVIASLVILILAAAVIAPPFVDWEARRDLIDDAISRAAGTQARTEGGIRVRLLPSPVVNVDRLILGSEEAGTPSLIADRVQAELALMPLLEGGIRFTDARVGRAEVRIPIAADGGWRLPPDIAAGRPGRAWAIDNLVVAQLLVTTEVASTGRTDQFFAEQVAIEGQKLTGPWRMEGLSLGVPFRFVTGELGEDQTIQMKLAGGGDVYPRFDIDAKLDLKGGTGTESLGLSGKAKVLFGPPAQVAAAGIPIPVAIETSFKTGAGAVELEGIALEAGEGGASLRMTGSGSIRTDEPRIALKLEGRRLDADSFILSSNGQDFASRLSAWSIPTTTIPLDLDLSLNSIGLAQEELVNAVLKARVLKGRAQVEKFEFLAPGETRVAMEGDLGLSLQGGASGRIGLASRSSDRLARYLAKLGLQGPFLRVLDGRPFEAASDVALALPVTSFRNLRLKAGDATLTGNLRFTAPEANARGKLEAQVSVQGLNLDQLPQVSSVFDATQNLDVGFILEARDVRAGNQRGGRISARILSDGPALLVEALDVVDLAGANARVSGRILPDGSGRIAGKVTARRAAPLIDLLGSVWIGGVSRLVPPFLRDGDLDLDVVSERAVHVGAAGQTLRTTARGTAAGGGLEGEALTIDGATQNLNVKLTTPNTGIWVDRANTAILRRPSTLSLLGTRMASGQFNVTLAGEVGGVKIETRRPFALGASDEVVDSGEADVSAADITPFLVLLGDGAGVASPVPMQARIAFGRERDSTLVTLAGRVSDNPFQARLTARSREDVSGTVSLDRLSLPWLVTSLALNAPADPNATAVWSTVRFGQTARLVTGGQVAFTVGRLDFGRGVQGREAKFTAVVAPEGLSIRDLQTNLADGRLTGALSVSRQGSLASVTGEGTFRDMTLSAIGGAPSPMSAKISGNLKVGAAAETFSGLISNLGGAGELRVGDLQVANADPAALERALRRLLADPDPLAPRRAETIVAEELNKAPLRSAPVTVPVTLVGGAMRLSPFLADGGTGSWQGSVAYDFKTFALDARGTLAARAVPQGWTGSPPSIGLNWRGPLAGPSREIEVGTLTNGLAAIVLQRELEKIEVFELDAVERQRRQQRLNFDRQRERDRVAFEEAARQARLRDEARLRAEADRARAEAERAQAEQRRATEQVPPAPTFPTLPFLGAPIDIRPAPQIQNRPGG